MSGTNVQDSLSAMKLTYRFMLRMRLITAQCIGDKRGAKAARTALQKDGALISAAGLAASSLNKSSYSTDQNTSISLSDLIQKLKDINSGKQTDTTQKTQTNQSVQTITYQEVIETNVNLSYSSLARVDGLVVRNENLAETDRYRFEFSDGTTLKIVDKWSNRSTTIYGDPHIDTSDEEGCLDGDFKDLTKSDRYTTFMLSDGTRLTITAYDSGLIEQVDIIKGNQHVSGTGSGSMDWSEDNALFNTEVKNDGTTAASAIQTGDVVYSGGDGNDWYDASKNLIWGKTTGAKVTSRPTSFARYEYYQKISRSFSVTQVSEEA